MKRKNEILILISIVLVGFMCIVYVDVSADYTAPIASTAIASSKVVKELPQNSIIAKPSIEVAEEEAREILDEIPLNDWEEENNIENIIDNYTSNETTQGYIYYAWSLFKNYEWSEYDLECLINLWHRESTWNPLAHNSSSGAHGIPQSLPASKMASHGDDYWDNPYTQINWGLDYIYNRYGNPANAWYHSESVGWY